MEIANIITGKDVTIDPSSTINNVKIGDHVKIAKRCSIYGGPENILEIGDNSYVGMNSVLNGFAAKLTIGNNVSISQFVNIMVDSGPNASPGMMKVFPIIKGSVTIGHDSWIGSSVIIMPNVILGEFCVVASNSFVNKSFPAYSILGGTPAKLIRTFTEEEKAKMNNVQKTSNPAGLGHYELHYLNLPFEDKLRRFRIRKLIEVLNKYPHGKILEIGPGAWSLFQYFKDFEEMIIVEPEEHFFTLVKTRAEKHKNVHVINNQIENSVDLLKKNTFDYIILGGFLHEVGNVSEVLSAIRQLCSNRTRVFSYVPNANSFHRVLAVKMGLIDSIFQKSIHDEIFEREKVFDCKSFNKLFLENKFKVVETGSYFIKPFTHSQMDDLLVKGIIDESVLEGFDRMIEFLPEMGTEIWNLSKKDDSIS